MVDNNIHKVMRHNIIFSILCVMLLTGAFVFYYLYIGSYIEHNEKHYEEAIVAINSTTNIESLKELAINSLASNNTSIDALIAGVYLIGVWCLSGIILTIINIRFLRKLV